MRVERGDDELAFGALVQQDIHIFRSDRTDDDIIRPQCCRADGCAVAHVNGIYIHGNTGAPVIACGEECSRIEIDGIVREFAAGKGQDHCDLDRLRDVQHKCAGIRPCC